MNNEIQCQQKYNIIIFDILDNCSCTGVKNKWGEGAECMVYRGYSDKLLNSKWCYAETTSCADATRVEFSNRYYVDDGRFGASQRACFKDTGNTLSKY